MSNQPEVLGIFITKQELSNMKVEHIHVSDFALQTILKSIKLNWEAQCQVIDKLVDRTPDWQSMTKDEQSQKMIVTLTQETVIEYLKLEKLIREDCEMVEVGIDAEGSIIVSAFYIEKTDLLQKVFPAEMSEEEYEALENQMNIFNKEIDIVGEAQKRLEALKEKGKIVPFQNRAARRKNKK